MAMFRRMDFWNKVRATLLLVGIGSEVTLFVLDSSTFWKWFAAGATFIAMALAIWIEDKDNDGYVDLLQKKKTKSKKSI